MPPSRGEAPRHLGLPSVLGRLRSGSLVAGPFLELIQRDDLAARDGNRKPAEGKPRLATGGAAHKLFKAPRISRFFAAIDRIGVGGAITDDQGAP